MAILSGIAAISLRIALFDTGVHAIPAFDDECKISLQAKQIARGSFPLLILGSPYIFPLEAYLQAPFINFLPRNAFGARILDFCMGLLTILFSLLILKKWGSWQETWPGIVLILFPSGYLLMLQVGCALPGYPTLMFLAALVIWLAQLHARAERRSWIPALLCGIGGGLAASDTMLALPILVMGGSMIILAKDWRTAIRSAPVFAAGSLIGLAPHLVAKHINSGAFQAVSQSVSLKTALKKIASPVLDRVLPSAFGWGPTIFPDHKERLALVQGFDLYIGIAIVMLLIIFTVVVLKNFFMTWRRERWPRIDTSMAFLGIAWMCLFLFIASSRSHHHTYRYFIPFVFSFPFLTAYTYKQSTRPGRWILGIITLLIVAINLTGTAGIINRWSKPGFADYLKSYDMQPAFEYLKQRSISRCYGTYTDAYRITYETDETIICCQPYNERFPGWNVPFSDIVNAATNVAFVLSDTYRFKPEDFERDLGSMQVKYRKETCGHYQVYTDFESQIKPAGAEINPKEITIETCCKKEGARTLNDGDYVKRWQSSKLQEKGMWIEIKLAKPRQVSQVKIYYNQYRHDRANAMQLSVFDGQKWSVALDRISRNLDCFDFVNGHPVYMNEVQTLRFTPITAERLKLEITEADAKRAWTLGEIRVFEASEK